MTAHSQPSACTSLHSGSKIIRIVKKLYVKDAGSLTLEMTAQANRDFLSVIRHQKKDMVVLFTELQRGNYVDALRYISSYVDFMQSETFGPASMYDCSFNGLLLTFWGFPEKQTLVLSSIELNGNGDGPDDGINLIIRPTSATAQGLIYFKPDDSKQSRIIKSYICAQKLEHEKGYSTLVSMAFDKLTMTSKKPSADRPVGTVKWYNAQRGFGFVEVNKYETDTVLDD